MPLFRFTQIEFPWQLGPPDGRYLLRRDGDPPDAAASHVIVFATFGAPERRRLQRKRRQAETEPEPVPVPVTRATVVEVGQPFASDAAAGTWLRGAGDDDLDAGLFVLNRAIHVYRLVTADPSVGPVGRHGALVARIGYGAGEQVADGQWTEAIELVEKTGRQSRAKVLMPQAHLAAVLTGRDQRLACEELTLRARLDFDSHRFREAALQVMIALDAAIAEITADSTGPRLAKRLDELGAMRDGIADAGQQALAGPIDDEARENVDQVLRRVESILRARAVLNA
ncbi:MAG: hypothetical protein ACYDHH_06890 [Solirubrobacteraceae bacterium]